MGEGGVCRLPLRVLLTMCNRVDLHTAFRSDGGLDKRKTWDHLFLQEILKGECRCTGICFAIVQSRSIGVRPGL